MALRIKWDQYETALLIDTFWKIEEHPELRRDLIEKLSNDLRKKAINQGIVIDDTFRNVNGITMQLTPIAHAFFPERPSLSSSAMFESIVKLYKEDRSAYELILKDAKKLAGYSEEDRVVKTDRQTRFTKWLAEKGKTDSEISELISALDSASKVARNRKLVPNSFWDVQTEVEFSIASAKLMTMKYFQLVYRALSKRLIPAIPLYSRFLDEELQLTEEPANSQNENQVEEDDPKPLEQQPILNTVDTDAENVPVTDAPVSGASSTGVLQDIPFDRTEIIYIIDNYILAENGTKEFSQAITEISNVLRKRADLFEQEIDENFRSKAVIEQCFSDVGRCLHNGGTESVNVDPLILQLTDLQKNDIKRYLGQSKIVWEQLAKLSILDSEEKETRPVETSSIEVSKEEPKPEPGIDQNPVSEAEHFISEVKEELLIDDDFLPDKAYMALKEECLKNQYGTTQVYIARQIGTTEKTVNRIFSKADWVKPGHGKYKLSDDPPSVIRILNLRNPASLAFTKPVKLAYFEDVVSSAVSWRGLYWDFICTLYKDYPEKINSIAGQIMPGDIVPLIKTSATSKTTVEFAPGLYIELNIPANTVAEYIKLFLDYCNVGLENVSIAFVRKELPDKDNPKEQPSKKAESTAKKDNQANSDPIDLQKAAINVPEQSSLNMPEQKDDIKPESPSQPNTSTSEKRTSGKKYYQVQKESFYSWLLSKKNLDSKEASSYIRILQAAEDFAREYISGDCKLFSFDEDIVESTLKELTTNKAFRISIINNRPNMAPAMRLFQEYHKIDSDHLYTTSGEPVRTNEDQATIPSYESPANSQATKPVVQEPVQDIENSNEPPQGKPAEKTTRPVVREMHTSTLSEENLDSFMQYLIRERSFSEKRAREYRASIQMIEEYIKSSGLDGSVLSADADNLDSIRHMLMSQPHFYEINKMYDYKLNAAMIQLGHYLKHGFGQKNEPNEKIEPEHITTPVVGLYLNTSYRRRSRIKDAIIDTLADVEIPLTAQEILEKIEKEGRYRFESNDKLSLVLRKLQKYALGTEVSFHAPQSLFVRYIDDDENVRWQLLSKDVKTDSAPQPEFIQQREKPPEVKPEWKASDILAIMINHFHYGLNVGSPIELHRFRNYYQSAVGNEFPESDTVLQKEIRTLGFEYEGKAYIIDNSVPERLLMILNDRHNSGSMFYYNLLYEKNEDWLFDGNILSAEMLKEYLIIKFPENKYKGSYFTTNSSTENEIRIIRDEILCVWGDGALRRTQDLFVYLPYVRPDKIKYALSYCDDFIRSEAETYTRRDRFVLSDEELQDIIEFVREKCDEDGSVAFEDLDLDDVAAENYELSESAIYAMVSALLPKEFAINGKLITKAENSTDAETALLAFCKNHDTCKLYELEKEMEKAVGYIRTDFVIDVASSIMVRVNEEDFVADKLVQFDIPAIDAALGEIVPEDGIGMKEISSFALFPYCGYPWNLFLIESFCRRFSQKFRFVCYRSNSKNAGAIVRKASKMDYHQLMAASLARSNIALDTELAYDHLVDAGFLQRKRYSNMKDLLKLAASMREE